MNILVQRIKSNENETLGKLSINGKFQCYTLEDEYREVKVKGETRIPQGSYVLKLRTVGGMHMRYGRRFPDHHKGMIWLQDVPNFQYIYVHVGNSSKDSEGCILVGSGYLENNGKITITASVKAYVALYEIVVKEILDGKLVTLTIVDEDR